MMLLSDILSDFGIRNWENVKYSQRSDGYWIMVVVLRKNREISRISLV
jgi:hypothetical protein